MVKIKICGLSRPQDVEAACGADYIGFVFAKSRRQISGRQARELKMLSKLPCVGVFVNEKPDIIRELLDTIDIIQLHGSEDECYIQNIRSFGRPVIKSANPQAYISKAADFLLFDSPNPGRGKVFDWSLIPKIDKPYFLAGGLSLDNVDQALQLQPYAVDVSSGVETNGLKDPNKIIQFIRKVREFNA